MSIRLFTNFVVEIFICSIIICLPLGNYRFFYTLTYENNGDWFTFYSLKNNQLIDETLISFFKSPHSFTGEDVVEINIHGSPYILKKITEIVIINKNKKTCIIIFFCISIKQYYFQ